MIMSFNGFTIATNVTLTHGCSFYVGLVAMHSDPAT